MINFQIDDFSSLYDWRESALHRFDWVRALSCEHQFENRYKVVFFRIDTYNILREENPCKSSRYIPVILFCFRFLNKNFIFFGQKFRVEVFGLPGIQVTGCSCGNQDAKDKFR